MMWNLKQKFFKSYPVGISSFILIWIFRNFLGTSLLMLILWYKVLNIKIQITRHYKLISLKNYLHLNPNIVNLGLSRCSPPCPPSSSTSKLCALVKATLNLFTLARKPRPCLSWPVISTLLTVVKMMTALSWPWNSSTLPTFRPAHSIPRELSMSLTLAPWTL